MALSQPDRDVQIAFANVFAVMTDTRREALIAMHMRRKGCSRIEAMRVAVEEQRKDADRAY